jgi:hypothetical protein
MSPQKPVIIDDTQRVVCLRFKICIRKLIMFFNLKQLTMNVVVIVLVVTIFASHSATSLKCKTTNGEGPQKNRPCVFPFVYQETTFESCTNRSDPDNKLWCSTKVIDAHGVENPGKGVS